MDTMNNYKIKIKTISLVVRETRKTIDECDKVKSSKVAAEIGQSIFKQLDDDQEHFVALFLNASNVITGYKVISSGGQDEAMVDPKVLFRNALLFGTSALIIIHNHPGGNVNPSSEDIGITKKLQEGAKILDIRILDHIIIGQATEEYFSFETHDLL